MPTKPASVEKIPQSFVIGHPINHSKSPFIHNYWLKFYDIKGEYHALDIPTEELTDFFKKLKNQPENSREWQGGNITIPHKEAVFDLVDEKTERAKIIGAINTVWFENNVLWGDNTDGLGFLSNLDQSLPSNWHQTLKTALVLGAGGAARAIITSLIERKIPEILITNRNQHRAEELKSYLELTSLSRLKVINWHQSEEVLKNVDLLINTTSLGMRGKPDCELNLKNLSRTSIVADIVYTPLETGLLKQASAQGLTTIQGLGMLLNQAAPGFKHWFGKEPEITKELRAAIIAELHLT